MNLEYKELLPQNFSPDSKVWIYQSSRLFSLSEALDIETLLNKFSAEWRSHGAEVNAYCNLFFGQFVVLMADETNVGVGGCSTDSSVRFIKELGQKFGVDFFDRTSMAFLVKDKIQMLPLNQLQYAFDNGFIDQGTWFKQKKNWRITGSFLLKTLGWPNACKRRSILNVRQNFL
jgi:hypothetical protein